MGKLLVKEHEIVVPGEILAEGMDYLPAGSSIRENDKIVATKLGLVNLNNRLVKVIPLSGRYTPKPNDIVIGTVSDIMMSGWRVDFGWAFQGTIQLKDGSFDYIERGADLTQYYNYGDLVATKIIKVVNSKIIDMTMKGPELRKLKGGKLIHVCPSKVPRIIGKGGSMISMIKEKTNCRIIVGQNGVVWISGQDPKMEVLATKAVLKIDKESHLQGLTDKIKAFLEKGA